MKYRYDSFSILISFLFLFVSNSLYAQLANDECNGAIVIPNVIDWCSNIAEFTNETSTPSGFGPASCMPATTNDVWFTFTSVATDVVIVVNGNSGNASGGTLGGPQVSLYTGNCNGTINEQECEIPNTGTNIVELYKGGMVIGETYFIRVQGLNNNMGTFQLCVNNFNPPVFPGSDCNTSAVLCDKTAFVIPQVIGAGVDPNEAGSTSCLGGFNNSESNSTWFSWVAANDGDLTFILTPLNASDDLDFVVFEVNGLQECDGKSELRCMASGDFVFPSPCMGPTGLAEGETDTSEPSGCSLSSQSNFLAPLDMTEGTTYALMINNFSGTGNGFSIEFGGSGEFAGPEADFFAQPTTACFNEPITFTDASSFPTGMLTSWVWNFGVGASPENASGPGPHQVTWSSPGPKSVALVVGTDAGCQLTNVQVVRIEQCCEDENAMTIESELTELLCPAIPDGAIDLTVTSNAPGHSFLWSTGATTDNISNLALGTYLVTITNAAGCDTVLTHEIGAPLGINIEQQITMPNCMMGMDGAVLLNVTGGVPPYQFNWASPLGSGNSINNIGVGLYGVTVTDANNCEEILEIDVREKELVLDTNIPTINPPSCFETFDGSVVFNIANGTPPFVFDYNDGNGFVTTNTFSGLNSGTFDVTFRDAAGCIGDTFFVVTPPPIVDLDISGINISCFGAEDGIAEVNVTGGVGNYTYLWSDPAAQTDSMAIGLDVGQYFVTVADGNACTKVASVSLTQPIELFLTVTGVENVLCFGDSTGSVSVVGGGGNPSYEYSLDEIEYQTDSTFFDIRAGTFDVFVRDELGCVSSISATIIEPEQLVVDAGRDTTVDLGFPVQLSGISFPLFRPVSYQWSPAMFLDCIDCQRVRVLPTETTTFFAMVTDSTGCVAEDSVRVSIVKNRPIYIPNAFSPNLDGQNDVFTIYGGPAAEQVKLMRIFNRWGALVYEGKEFPLNNESPNNGWDGTFKGEVLPPDVFVYYVVVSFIDGVDVSYEGDITILK